MELDNKKMIFEEIQKIVVQRKMKQERVSNGSSKKENTLGINMAACLKRMISEKVRNELCGKI